MQKRRTSSREEVSWLVMALNFLGIDTHSILSLGERKQILDAQFNNLPGETLDDKMEFVKTHGKPSDIKLIKTVLYDPTVKAEKLKSRG